MSCNHVPSGGENFAAREMKFGTRKSPVQQFSNSAGKIKGDEAAE
jgi:hypothetical protein